MSLPESSSEEAPSESLPQPRGILVRQPRTNIYTVLLGISAAALAVASLIVVFEIWQYGPPWTFPWNIPINLR